MSGCTTPATAQFAVTVPPQISCQEGEGSKFTIDVQTEHCLRTGQLVCTMMVGGKLEVIIGNKNNNNPNDDGEIKLDPGVIEWLGRGFCVTHPARFSISQLNPMLCTLQTQGWIGTIFHEWTTTNGACCDPQCGVQASEPPAAPSDWYDLASEEPTVCAPEWSNNIEMLFVNLDWCDTVQTVRLVCEMSGG